MEFLKELLPIIFLLVVIPALGILTAFLVQLIQKWKEELKQKTDNELLKKYIDLLAETITSCVIATNQTYVESLKQQGKFDMEAQKEAFKKSADAVMAILTEDAKEYLTTIVGDVETYITKKIESSVNQNKK